MNNKFEIHDLVLVKNYRNEYVETEISAIHVYEDGIYYDLVLDGEQYYREIEESDLFVSGSL